MRISLWFLPLLGLSCMMETTVHPAAPDGQSVVSAAPDSVAIISYDSAKKICKKYYSRLKVSGSQADEARLVGYITDSIIPYWYGTPWDFNGMTQVPRQGKIACGYFVTTVLRDAGMPLQRIRLSQMGSADMIKAISPAKKISWFHNKAQAWFIDSVNKLDPGLYIIGLDNHTGFIHKRSDSTFFIHSTYVGPSCVFREPMAASWIISGSKMKVLGRVVF